MDHLKIIYCVFFTVFFSSVFAQKCRDIEENDSTKKLVGKHIELPLPNVIYRDYSNSFFKWKEKPKSFIFQLFDRWGNIVLKENKPDLALDADNVQQTFNEGVYFYRVEIITNSGENICFFGKAVYTGEYYMCG